MNTEFGNWENPNVYESVGCFLHISGMNFDPDALLHELNLPEEKIRFRGVLGIPEEYRDKLKVPLPGFPDPLRVFDMSNLLITLSEATDISSQIREAILFFQQHLTDLKKITSQSGVEDVNLRFITESDKSDFQDFPPDFYDLTAEIGVRAINCGEPSKNLRV